MISSVNLISRNYISKNEAEAIDYKKLFHKNRKTWYYIHDKSEEYTYMIEENWWNIHWMYYLPSKTPQ